MAAKYKAYTTFLANVVALFISEQNSVFDTATFCKRTILERTLCFAINQAPVK